MDIAGKQGHRGATELSTPPLCRIFYVDSENGNESLPGPIFMRKNKVFDKDLVLPRKNRLWEALGTIFGFYIKMLHNGGVESSVASLWLCFPAKSFGTLEESQSRKQNCKTLLFQNFTARERWWRAICEISTKKWNLGRPGAVFQNFVVQFTRSKTVTPVLWKRLRHQSHWGIHLGLRNN